MFVCLFLGFFFFSNYGFWLARVNFLQTLQNSAFCASSKFFFHFLQQATDFALTYVSIYLLQGKNILQTAAWSTS